MCDSVCLLFFFFFFHRIDSWTQLGDAAADFEVE